MCIGLVPFSALTVALFTEDPQNATAPLGGQATFLCSFEDLDAFPNWEDSTGQSYTIANVAGDVRYIKISNMTIALNVTATAERDGVCYFCTAPLVSGPVSSESGCLTVVGK